MNHHTIMFWKEFCIGLLIGFGTHYIIISSGYPILLSPIPFHGIPLFIALSSSFTRRFLDPSSYNYPHVNHHTINPWKEFSIGLLISFGTIFGTIFLSGSTKLLSLTQFYGLPLFISLSYTFTRIFLEHKQAPFTSAICKSKSISNA